MKASSPPPAAPASRRQFDRQEALETAMQLFWRHGYESTSMAMLLEAMDLTAPSLYAAFGNKEKLFIEAVRHYASIYGAKVFGPLAEPISAREAIERVLLNSVASVSSSKNPAGCLVSFGALNCSDEEDPAAELLRELRQGNERVIRERLVRAVREKELPASANPARLTRFYCAVLGGIQLLSLDGATRSELEAVAEDAMAHWPGKR
jgi:AcrR family transcriptional regulator